MTNETQQVEISAGHTPGPWRIERRDGQAHGFGIYHGINTFVVSPHTGVIDESDAHLIAAAPDLLEALVVALDALYDYGDSSVTGTIESAIRKARGEAAS